MIKPWLWARATGRAAKKAAAGVTVLALALALGASHDAALALAISRGVQNLNLSYQDCLSLAHQAFLAEGYTSTASRGEGFVSGFKANHGGYINCTPIPGTGISVIIVMATEGVGDGNIPGNERVRLQQRMAQSPGVVAPPPAPPPVAPPPSPPPVAATTWYTKAEIDAPDGRRFSFECPPLTPAGFLSMWGTDVYTYDSGICMAGVHSGVITRERGGMVTIEMRPGQASYPSTTRNGVSSQGYGSYGKSFAVVTGGAQPVAPPPTTLPLVPPSPRTCQGFAGSWQTDFGAVPLQLQGNRATGTYTQPAGSIDGIVSGSQLDGNWRQRDRSGLLRFTLSADGMSFSGRWTEANGSGGGAWNGRCTGPPAAPATTTTSSTPPRFLGCYKDPNNPFDLEGYLVRSAQNTPQRCIETCAARGFKLAGVQYGQSCLCGNNYGASTSACDDTRGGRYPLTA